MRELLRALEAEGSCLLLLPEISTVSQVLEGGRTIPPSEALTMLDQADATEFASLEFEERALAAVDDPAGFVQNLYTAELAAMTALEMREAVAGATLVEFSE